MSVSLSDIEGAELIGPGGETLGTVRNVLFHPLGARAVGLMVEPPAVGGVVRVGASYVGLGGVSFKGRMLSRAAKKLPRRAEWAAELGIDPDSSIVWTGMPVSSSDGVEAGRVHDAEFDPDTGAVSSVTVSGGMTSDAAVGSFSLDGKDVEGYAGGRLRVSPRFAQIESAGGLARGAGRAAGVVSVKGEQAASVAGDALVKASGQAGSAIHKLRKRGASGVWQDLTSAFKEGYDEGDDES